MINRKKYLKTTILMLFVTMLGCQSSNGEKEQIGVDEAEIIETDLDNTPDMSSDPLVTITINDSTSNLIITDHYEAGGVKSISEQGDVNGCEMQINVEKNFDENGTLTSEKYFDHFLLPGDKSCHETRTVVKFVTYHSNGSIANIEEMESCYECDSCECGNWITLNESGDTLSSVYKGDCYDGELDCLIE